MIYLEIRILKNNGILEPKDITEVLSKVPPAPGSEPIILSGRLPVWLYAVLTHYYHPRPFVCTFEPRMGKGVVVASHIGTVKEGDLVEINECQKVIIEI